jgi:hypothetical protein
MLTISPRQATPLAVEFRLLIACSWLPQTSQSSHIAQLCAEGVRWDEFLALVRRHQVPSLAYKILRTERIPVEVRRELKELSASACAAALHTAAELARLSRAFTQDGIAVMPLKGVMLSIQLFGDPATRHPGDLDLMVKPEDFDRAGELLVSLGYRSKLTRPMQKLVRAHGYECSYWHDRLQLLADVHWTQELWTAAQISELWTHCRNTSWMGIGMQLLDGDALLLFLCDHGSRHKWSRIKWLGDVAMLFSKPRASPWNTLFEMAARFGLEQTLAETAVLVQRWYGVEIPFIAKRGTARKRRKTLNQLLIQPEDLKQFPLPRPFVWLYYPLRPLFWFWRQVEKRSFKRRYIFPIDFYRDRTLQHLNAEHQPPPALFLDNNPRQVTQRTASDDDPRARL